MRPSGHCQDKNNMKASDVRVLPALEHGESYVDPLFLLVETVVDEHGQSVTTIEQLGSNVIDGKERWTVRTVGQSVPLSHRAACRWAVSYAASRGIPLVYEREEIRYAAAFNVTASASANAAK
jgi:hypothetical protein